MNLSTEGLERSTAHAQRTHQEMREDAVAMIELLDAIESAFNRREGAEWRRLRSSCKDDKGTTTLEMNHWWVPNITIGAYFSFPWSIRHISAHEFRLFLREDGALVKRAVDSQSKAFGNTSALNLEELNLDERRALTQALNRFNPARV